MEGVTGYFQHRFAADQRNLASPLAVIVAQASVGANRPLKYPRKAMMSVMIP